MTDISKTKEIDALQRIVGSISSIMRNTKISAHDVGKVFVMDKNEKSGKIMNRSQLERVDLSTVGGWCYIDQIDVNQH